MFIYLSNRLERLYQLLNEGLSHSTHPLHIFVPSLLFKSYLIENLSKNYPEQLQILSKIELLEVGIEKLLQTDTSSPRFLTFFEYKIALLELLQKEKKGHLEPMIDRLSFDFLQRSWGTNPEPRKGPSTFYQQQVDYLWELTQKEYSWKLPKDIMREDATFEALQQKEIVLFGFSSLPPSYHQFFTRLAEKSSVSYYIISPCRMFWGDVLSDRDAEIFKLRMQENPYFSQRESLQYLDELLFDRNRLLANCGKNGRQFMQLLEEGENKGKVKEFYVMNQAIAEENAFQDQIGPDDVEYVNEAPSLLRAIQSDLLLLNGKRKDKIAHIRADTTIQIHSTPTLLREVEVLHEKLSLFLEKISKQQLSQPVGAMISVFLPDIPLYAPYIDRIFGKPGTVFSSSYHILGVENRGELFLRTFISIVDLPKKHFRAELIMELFRCEAFYRKLEMKKEDVIAFEELLLTSGFRSERNWQTVEIALSRVWLNAGVDTSTAKALGNALFAVRSLLKQDDAPRSLKEWIILLKMLFESYFIIDCNHAQEQQEYEVLNRTFEKMESFVLISSQILITVEQLHSLWGSITKEFLTESTPLEKKMILFHSLKEPPLPARMICFLGMDSESKIVFDQYRFIEALLAARDSIYISYQGFSFQEQKTIESSSLVQELIRSIEEGYEITSTQLIQVHPLVPAPQKTAPIKNRTDLLLSKNIDKELQLIDVSLLFQVAKSPLKPYFQHALGISLPSFVKERVSSENQLSRYDFSKLHRLGLELSQEEFVSIAKDHPKMPEGILKESCLKYLQDTRADFIAATKEFGLAGVGSITIELSINCTIPQEISKGHFLCPAIAINEKMGRYIVGRLDKMIPEGILFFERYTKAAIVRAFPELLLRAYLQERYRCFSGQQLFFLKDRKVKNSTILDPEIALYNFVEHAVECHQRAIAVYPEWVEDLLQEVNLSQKAAEKVTDLVQDPYLKFFMRRYSSEIVTEQIPIWRKRAQELFAGVFDAPL